MVASKLKFAKSITSASAKANGARPGARPSPAGARRAAPPPAPAPAKVATPLRRVQPHVIWEDHRQLVLNKPAGTAMQGQYGSTARRLWDNLLEDLEARDESPKLFPVHRLDKSTSGTLLLAKSSQHAKALSRQFANHEVQRTYLSIVHGCIKPGFVGEIDTSLRVDDERVVRCEAEEVGALSAKTQWECIATGPDYSLVSFKPATGRKHQLRVHAAESLKAPIVGDFKYAPDAPHRALLPLPSDTILLHSVKISFNTWDRDGKRTTVNAIAPVSSVFTRFCRAAGLTIPDSFKQFP